MEHVVWGFIGTVLGGSQGGSERCGLRSAPLLLGRASPLMGLKILAFNKLFLPYCVYFHLMLWAISGKIDQVTDLSIISALLPGSQSFRLSRCYR